MIELGATTMHGDPYKGVFREKEEKELQNLFDDSEEIIVSGNEDHLDRIKSVCLACGRINGRHSPDCDEDYI